MENINKNFDSEICYIEGVVYSIKFQEMSSDEQVLELRGVLNLKLKQVYEDGISHGETNIKSKINKALL